MRLRYLICFFIPEVLFCFFFILIRDCSGIAENERRNITAIASSPSGERFVVVSGTGKESELFLFRPEADQFERLTFDRYEDRDPCFESDGSRIIYSSRREGKFAIFSLDLRTRKSEQVCTGESDLISPVCSFTCRKDSGRASGSSSRYIAFIEKEVGKEYGIIKYIDAAGDVSRTLVDEPRAKKLCLLPDDSALLFSSRRGIELIEKPFGERILEPEILCSEESGNLASSPHGAYVAYIRLLTAENELMMVPLFSPVRASRPAPGVDDLPFSFEASGRKIFFLKGGRLMSVPVETPFERFVNALQVSLLIRKFEGSEIASSLMNGKKVILPRKENINFRMEPLFIAFPVITDDMLLMVFVRYIKHYLEKYEEQIIEKEAGIFLKEAGELVLRRFREEDDDGQKNIFRRILLVLLVAERLLELSPDAETDELYGAEGLEKNSRISEPDGELCEIVEEEVRTIRQGRQKKNSRVTGRVINYQTSGREYSCCNSRRIHELYNWLVNSSFDISPESPDACMEAAAAFEFARLISESGRLRESYERMLSLSFKIFNIRKSPLELLMEAGRESGYGRIMSTQSRKALLEACRLLFSGNEVGEGDMRVNLFFPLGCPVEAISGGAGGKVPGWGNLLSSVIERERSGRFFDHPAGSYHARKLESGRRWEAESNIISLTTGGGGRVFLHANPAFARKLLDVLSCFKVLVSDLPAGKDSFIYLLENKFVELLKNIADESSGVTGSTRQVICGNSYSFQELFQSCLRDDADLLLVPVVDEKGDSYVAAGLCFQ